MNISPKKYFKITAAVSAAVICLTMIVSAAFAAIHADHDCTGENCGVCAAIMHCADIFGTNAGNISAKISLTGVFICTGILLLYRFIFSTLTSVSLFVKLLN